MGEGKGLALLWSKIKKLKIALSFSSPEKENYLLYIYEVITWEKFHKRADDDVFYLFLQKQNLGAKLHIYL